MDGLGLRLELSDIVFSGNKLFLDDWFVDEFDFVFNNKINILVKLFMILSKGMNKLRILIGLFYLVDKLFNWLFKLIWRFK